MMYGTFILLIMLVIGMAKKGRRGRRWTSNMKSVRVDGLNTLGTLADGIVTNGTMLDASDEEYRVLSLSTIWTLRDFTAGEGPIVVGYAHGDYSVTEVKECLDAQAAIARGDKIVNEQANRLVRIVGAFPGILANESLNDGKPIRTRLNWHIPDGKTVVGFAWAKGGVANLTTGADVQTFGKATIKYS